MKYVLDASVGLKWIFNEPHAAKAREIREQFKNGAHDLLAPDIFPIEVAHALSKAYRQRRISEEQSQLFLADILSTAPGMAPSISLLTTAYQMSLQSRASLYDCLYLALAEQESCQLLTADSKIGKLKGYAVVQLADLAL